MAPIFDEMVLRRTEEPAYPHFFKVGVQIYGPQEMTPTPVCSHIRGDVSTYKAKPYFLWMYCSIFFFEISKHERHAFVNRRLQQNILNIWKSILKKYNWFGLNQIINQPQKN